MNRENVARLVITVLYMFSVTLAAILFHFMLKQPFERALLLDFFAAVFFLFPFSRALIKPQSPPPKRTRSQKLVLWVATPVGFAVAGVLGLVANQRLLGGGVAISVLIAGNAYYFFWGGKPTVTAQKP